MKKLTPFQKGIMLINVLMLAFLMVMLTTSIIALSVESLNITGKLDRRARALQAAEGGIEYSYYQLNKNPSWTPSAGLKEELDNEQTFEFVYSVNNLMSPTASGSTPAYTMEIICKGCYKEYSTKIRAIFIRDDIMDFPLYSEGIMDLTMAGCPIAYFPNEVFKIKGKSSNDPGIIHSNDTIKITGNTGPSFDFNEGLVTACSNVNITNVSNYIKKKDITDDVIKKNIPDIDINEIISSRPSCHELSVPDNTYYLVGFFEFDDTDSDPANWYCIPHSSPTANSSTNKAIHTSTFKTGIASFNEPNCLDFIKNYGECYWDGPPPMNYSNDNLYDYYSSISFWEYGTSDFADIESELGMTVNVASDNTITLSLDDDIYIPGTTGIFMTEWMCRSGWSPGYILSTMDDSRVKLDLNNKKIYTEKPFYLGIPPVGRGAIISADTIDFQHFYEVDMIALSEKSIRLVYDEPPSVRNAVITYNGLIYAKDDILIQTNSAWRSGKKININGNLVCKNEGTGSTGPSPMAYKSGIPGSASLYVEAVLLEELNLESTCSGMMSLKKDYLVDLRGNNFKVTKHSWQILE